MPKKYRITRSEFSRFERRDGKRLHGAFVSLLAAPLSDAKHAKTAFVISKKISARAVDRNQIERRLRPIMHSLIRSITAPLALVVYAKREALGASSAQLEKDVRALVARATMPKS